MNNPLRKLARPVFICLLIFMSNRQGIFAMPFRDDSLRTFLAHFRQNTNDSDFKKVVEKVEAICTKDTLNDSLIAKLIEVEYLLTNVIDEDLLINFKPFNRQIVFSFAEKLVNISQQLPPQNESLLYASALNNCGALYQLLGEWQKGNRLLEKAFTIRQKNLSEQDCDYAESLINMAKACYCKGNKNRGLDFLRKALILTKKEGLKFRVLHANCLFFLGTVYRTEYQQYDTAAQFFESELNERKKIVGEENAHYALCLYKTSDMLQYLWQFDKAVSLVKQAIDLTQKTLGEKSLQYAYLSENLASDYYNLAEYKKALPLYRQSLATKEQLFGKDYSDNSISQHYLAITYQQMGDYSSALPLFQRAEEISKKAFEKGLELDFNYAYSINYLAFLYQAMGQYSEALPLLKKALRITERSSAGQGTFYARTLNSLAIVYENMHRYDTAWRCYKKVLEIRHKMLGETDPEYAASLDNLARLCNKMGKYDIAIQLCRQGLQVRKSKLGERSPAYAASLNNLGELYMKQGKYGEAADLLNQSLTIRKKVLGDSHPDYVKSLNSLGLLNMALGKNATAEEIFAEANNIELKHILGTYTSLSEQEKLNLINQEYLQFSYLPSLLYKNPVMASAILQQVYTNCMTLKGMVLDDQKEILKSIRRSGDSIALQQYDKWHFNKAFLGKQLLMPLLKRLPYFDSLQQVTDQLEQELSRNSVAFRNQQQNQIITTKAITNKLVKGEAAVEFIKFKLYDKKWTDSTIYAALLLLPGDSIPKFIPLFEEKKLKRLLETPDANQLYPAINNSSQNSTAKTTSLFNLVWKPLEKYFVGVNTVNYSPTGLLHRIACQALPCDSSHLLIDKYQFNQLFSTGSLVMPARVTKPGSINLWGDIQYDFQSKNINSQVYADVQNRSDNRSNSFARPITSTFNFYTPDTRESRGNAFGKLPGTKLEIENINNLFLTTGTRVSRVSDTAATEEAFKALDGKSPQVLHIATHGFFLPVKENKVKNNTADNPFTVQENPMFRSGLVLAGGNPTWKGEPTIPGKEDGILTAYEISQMDLSNTDLVVLSACQTALGDLQGNEGVIGLQRAFKMAGVKQLIMSLWKIPDVQTTELMTKFYSNWLAGQSTREALRSAQLAIKEKYPSPYFWAGFVLVE